MIKSSQNGKDLAKLRRQVLDLERKKRKEEKIINQQNKVPNDTSLQNTPKR